MGSGSRKHPVIEALTGAGLRGCLTRTANFFSQRRIGGIPVNVGVAPPKDAVEDIISMSEPPFPVLEGIVETPVVRPDGSILAMSGYDVQTALYYKPDPNLSVPDVPKSPSPFDLAVALAVIDEVFTDFPFVDQAARANAVALLLTVIARPAIDGQVPLALLDKPSPGTGATLISKVISEITTGRSAALMTAPRNDEEWRKKVTATLLEGPLIIIIDNVKGALSSDSLSAALTSANWKDRRLGVSETIEVPQRAV
jgi:hypothetical protein